MSIDTDSDKIKSIINSCKTKQHFIIVSKMIALFQRKWEFVFITPYTDYLETHAHIRSVEIRRKSADVISYKFC